MAYDVGYYKLESNKLHANIQQLSHELIINIYIHHLQYVFQAFNANYEIKDDNNGESYFTARHQQITCFH